jgi:hypothetical protein
MTAHHDAKAKAASSRACRGTRRALTKDAPDSVIQNPDQAITNQEGWKVKKSKAESTGKKGKSVGKNEDIRCAGRKPDEAGASRILNLVSIPPADSRKEAQVEADIFKAAFSFEIDGEMIVFDAKRDIVLRCGESSITLTRAGKIIIRGKYVVSDSTGLNQIRGGKIKLN